MALGLLLAGAPQILRGDRRRRERIVTEDHFVRAHDFAVLERKRIERTHEFVARHDQRRRDVCPCPSSRVLRTRLQIVCRQVLDERQACQRLAVSPFNPGPVRDDGEESADDAADTGETPTEISADESGATNAGPPAEAPGRSGEHRNDGNNGNNGNGNSGSRGNGNGRGK